MSEGLFVQQEKMTIFIALLRNFVQFHEQWSIYFEVSRPDQGLCLCKIITARTNSRSGCHVCEIRRGSVKDLAGDH